MNDAGNANPQTDHTSGNPPPPAPVIPPHNQGILTHAEEDRANHEQEATKNMLRELLRETRTVEWLQFGVSLALAIIGIFALCIYNGQLVAMRGQLDQMSKQLPELQKAAGAAASAAQTAKDTLDASTRNFRAQQRPYLWPVPSFVNLRGDANPNLTLDSIRQARLPFEVNVIFKNGGLTAAVNFHVTTPQLIVDDTDRAIRRTRNYVPKFPKGEGGFIPQGIHAMTSSGSSSGLTDSLIAELRSEKKAAFIVGEAMYTDSFSPPLPPYRIRYCYRINPLPGSQPFMPCDFKISDKPANYYE